LQNFSIKKALGLFSFVIILVTACGTPYEPEEDEDQEQEEQQEEQISDTDAVPADDILETVTWNVEWYGSGFSGPPNFDQQTKNIIRVVDSLNADLYGFQEVNGQDNLNNLVSKMTGYRGFIAEHVGQSQKMAFAYNTNTIDSLDSGAINSKDVRAEYQDDWSYNWAGGRLPLYFEFDFTFEGTTETFYAVVIHGKANTGSSAAEYEKAYQRRKEAAEGLYYYLQDEKPDANIILLGDYNDDVDQSIYYESGSEGSRNYAETPYYLFVENSDYFDVITKKLSDSDQSASINYEDIIDHITMSNELFDNYVQNSTAVYDAPQSYIKNYGETTSDHLPVWAKFDITPSQKVPLSK
jgi:endonuclease/exonuclease/phosphatase family metal-dependent hydrolase